MMDGPRGGRRSVRAVVPFGRVACVFACAVSLVPGTALAAPSPTPTPTQSAAVPGQPEEVRLTPHAERVGSFADPRIVNPSGLAASKRHAGVLWVLSGNRLFAVNGRGQTVGAYTLGGPPAFNMRAIAIREEDNGDFTLLLGDLGDNRKRRRGGVWLYSVPEPKTLGNGRLTPVRHRLAYPDGPHDAGTLMVDPYDQRAYVVTVSPTGGNLYVMPSVLGDRMRNMLAEVRPVHFIAQDGLILPDGRVVLRGRLQAHVLDGVKGARLAYLQMPQPTEFGPIALSADGKSLYTVGKTRESGIWRVAMPAAPGPSFTRGGDVSREVPETKIEEPSPLPGGVLGTASLAALLAIGAASGVMWLRRRRTVPPIQERVGGQDPVSRIG
jgi:hypothetical protein